MIQKYLTSLYNIKDAIIEGVWGKPLEETITIIEGYLLNINDLLENDPDHYYIDVTIDHILLYPDHLKGIIEYEELEFIYNIMTNISDINASYFIDWCFLSGNTFDISTFNNIYDVTYIIDYIIDEVEKQLKDYNVI